MNDSRFAEFLEAFDARVSEAAISARSGDESDRPMDSKERAFTVAFLQDMEDLGLVVDTELVRFEGKLGRTNGKLDAYTFSEDGVELLLVVAIVEEDESGHRRSVAGGEIIRAAKAAVAVFRAARKPLHEEMGQACPERDMMERFYTAQDNISTIRAMVLVDGVAGKVPEFEQPDDFADVTLDVWDVERLFRAASSGLAYESITIDIEKILGAPLPCLQGPTIADDHRCHLVIVPGDLLHDLYHEHGPRLLELNVRSFLQARGKVNRGIRDTLLEDSGRFLAYNNGISATVEELELTGEGAGGAVGIRKMKGLQVVNGGQTLASIHRAKDRDKADLSKVFVQAKITVIQRELVDELVPMISRFSNTQNKVNETDFSANHPFHVKFQQLAEVNWTPGEVTRWFYERARGQWEVARIREGATPAKQRAFDERTPRQQKVDKSHLSKALNSWGELPHVVSLGGQKCFVAFMNNLKGMGANWEPDERYYKAAIAKVIVFNRAEKIARQIGFSAYRANAVCYTVALLSYRTAGRINLEVIWTNQGVSPVLEATLTNWMPRVHEEIISSAGQRNVTEWCKKKECWAMVQSLDLKFEPGFEDELASGQPLPNVGGFKVNGDAKSKAKPLTHDERERQARVMKLGAEEWQEIIAWMLPQPQYAGFPVDICGTILGYAAAGWQKVPSPRQTSSLIGFIDAWNEHRTEVGVFDN